MAAPQVCDTHAAGGASGTRDTLPGCAARGPSLGGRATALRPPSEGRRAASPLLPTGGDSPRRGAAGPRARRHSETAPPAACGPAPACGACGPRDARCRCVDRAAGPCCLGSALDERRAAIASHEPQGLSSASRGSIPSGMERGGRGQKHVRGLLLVTGAGAEHPCPRRGAKTPHRGPWALARNSRHRKLVRARRRRSKKGSRQQAGVAARGMAGAWEWRGGISGGRGRRCH